jgi:alkylation response protein AidB-like acyl-CoA dehydrogenase
MFDALVEQGKDLRDRAAEAADQALKAVREQAGEAQGRWDKLEQVFEDRVSRSLQRLGVLTTREVGELSRLAGGVPALHHAKIEFLQNSPPPVLVDPRVRRIGRDAPKAADFTAIDRLETKDWAFARHLLQRCGELGLLGVDAPEEYGGIGLDKAAALVVSSHTAGSASFSAAFGATGNLAISPILYFGTAEQKTRYLPKLISGEMVGAYALSESGSGSDALGASARAVRLADGGFSITGEKMWITNGGFADVFIVFAKVDGEKFTAFIVDKGLGVVPGHEEKKLGLDGSSTTAVMLEDAKVPVENVLGEIGK